MIRALVATIFISLINHPSCIIDHGSMLYLILMQILLYDQQNVLSYAAVTTPIMMKAYNTSSESHFTVCNEIPSAISDGVPSTIIADEALYDLTMHIYIYIYIIFCCCK